MKPIASLFWFGVLFLVIGGVFLSFKLPYLTRGVRVDGVIVRVEERPNRRGYVYYPVVRYQAGSRTVKITGSVGASPNPYHVGQEVSVIYLPEQPESGIISDFVQLFLFPAIFGGLGLGAAVCALAFAYMSFLQRSRPKDAYQDFSVRPA